MRTRHLAVKRLFWLYHREAFDAFFKRGGMRPTPYPDPYPDHCWNWWRAAS